MKTRDTRGETRDQRPETSDPAAVRAGSRRFGRWPLVSGPWSRAQRDRGFALLLVVTLLAFIVLLLLGLAVYTRIETGVAGNTQRQAQARENALLGLNVAIAQLQRYAGPDTRVTATARTFSPTPLTPDLPPPTVDRQRMNYTGVWDTTNPGKEPLAWLASGVESPSPDNISASIPASRRATLLGTRTDGTAAADNTSVSLQDIRVAGVPGTSAATSATIGRYAWWVGDQGVKAPVAVSDNIAAVDYVPYNSTELNSRLRQQLPQGGGASDTTGAPVFEPRDINNTPLVRGNKVVAPNQLSFLRTAANAQVGLARIQQNFHHWSPNNYAVLANSGAGGLRRDLSLRPDLQGPGFVGWANYQEYMELPAAGALPGQTATTVVPMDSDLTFSAMIPPYGPDPIRRRYLMRGESASYRVAPVLSFFGISFSIRNNPGNSALEVSARCVVGLWNPYTSALVPEDLQIVVKGLPSRVSVHDSVSPSHQHVDLAAVMADQNNGGDLMFLLPFVADSLHEDRSSWLPGRVYNWSAESNTADPTNGRGKPMAFYERAAAQKGSGIVRATTEPALIPSTNSVPVTRWCRVTNETVLTLELRRASNGEKLAEFHSPLFADFTTDPKRLETTHDFLDFAYIFRLPDLAEIPLNETATWLQAPGRDPREHPFPTRGYVAPGFGLLPDGRVSPELLIQSRVTTFDASYPDFLLDRDPSSGTSFNEDISLFELPRAPLLSLGSLQHLFIPNARPFSIGNSWGGLAANAVFDQCFFSGAGPGTEWKTVQQPLPNAQLHILRRKADGSEVLPDEINGSARLADGYSSRHLLQGAAFNLNSSSRPAWIAVLRSLRFSAGTEFSFLDADATAGTAADIVALPTGTFLDRARTAVFPRFAQSAQEVFKADPGYQQSQFGGSGPVIDAPLFRRGMRALNAADVALLADRIVALIAQKHADSGPFRSVAEFLDVSPLFTNAAGVPVSLLEKAIEDASLNDDLHSETGRMVFSPQWLTQADIMTVLAPILFARSDTFIIRAYGEAVNPALLNADGTVPPTAIEGRAWCEALVQRVPEYFDRKDNDSDLTGDYPETSPANLSSDLNKIHGRRFKVVSFRWLTRSDI